LWKRGSALPLTDNTVREAAAQSDRSENAVIYINGKKQLREVGWVRVVFRKTFDVCTWLIVCPNRFRLEIFFGAWVNAREMKKGN